MDHSDVTVTMNTCLRLGLDDAQQEKIRHQEWVSARKEIEKMAGKKPEIILIKNGIKQNKDNLTLSYINRAFYFCFCSKQNCHLPVLELWIVSRTH